jgi:hypothetical protein
MHFTVDMIEMNSLIATCVNKQKVKKRQKTEWRKAMTNQSLKLFFEHAQKKSGQFSQFRAFSISVNFA